MMGTFLALKGGRARAACSTQLAGANTHASSKNLMLARRWRKSFMPVRAMSMSRPLVARRKEVVTRGTYWWPRIVCNGRRACYMQLICLRKMCHENTISKQFRRLCALLDSSVRRVYLRLGNCAGHSISSIRFYTLVHAQTNSRGRVFYHLVFDNDDNVEIAFVVCTSPETRTN